MHSLPRTDARTGRSVTRPSVTGRGRGATVVIALASLVAVACTSSVDSGGAGGPPAHPLPAVPAGPVDPATRASLDALFADPLLLDRDRIVELGGAADPRVAWPLVDLLRFHTGQRDGPLLHQALGRLTAVEAPDYSVAWVFYTDRLLMADVPAPPRYLAWKRTIFVAVEAGWAPFFADDADLDWRLVTWGGVMRDGIRALVDPAVVVGRKARWLPAGDTVFGVVVGGEARAYPLRMLAIHELVTDTLGGRRIALAYCTLCGSAVGYFVDGIEGARPLDLRTSGLLQRSNKLMYDAGTESLFDQFRGVSVAGPLRGVELTRTPVVVTTLREWTAAHPATTVLAAGEGTDRTYSPDPLGDRDAEGPIFPVGRRDDRLPAQERVFGVSTTRGVDIAFPTRAAIAALEQGRSVRAAGVELRLQAGGLAARQVDGPDLVGQEAFWFAWSQFHPGSLVWTPKR